MRAMIAMVIAATLALVGCNTVHGVGEDIEKLGDKIQRKAE